MTTPHFSGGLPSITTYLCFRDTAKAIDFYKAALGAEEVGARIAMPDGGIGHAQIRIGDTLLMASDEWPEGNVLSAETLGGSPIQLQLYVEDVDTFAAKAIDAGMKLLRPIEDQFYGDRSGHFVDPFGYRWSIGTHKEEVSDEELQRRAKELYGS